MNFLKKQPHLFFRSDARQGESITMKKKWSNRKSVGSVFMLAAFAFIVCLATSARAQNALDGFDPNANGSVFVVVVQPDGKILIGGNFTTLSPNGGAAVRRNRISPLNPDGALDTALNPKSNNDVFSIAGQADGKVFTGGGFIIISRP